MRWRSVGPYRGGRTKSAAGVASQPNVFYIGVCNGGVWKSTDYGRTWNPIFDDQPTGSIGAVAVAPSDPEHHLRRQRRGPAAARPLRRRRRLQIHRRRQDLDASRPARRPADPADRGRSAQSRTGSSSRCSDIRTARTRSAASIVRPTAASLSRRCSARTSNVGASDVQIDPVQSRRRLCRAVGSAPGAVGEQRVDRPRRRHLQIDRRRHHVEAAHARAFPTASSRRTSRSRRATRSRLYASIATGERRRASIAPTMPASIGRAPPTTRVPPAASAAATSPSRRSIPKIPTSSTSPAPSPGNRSTAARRGPAFRGAPGGDDYQRIWINPNHPEIILLVSDQGAIVTVNGGETWSSWYNQPTAQMYHVNADNAFPYRFAAASRRAARPAC